MHVRNNRVLFSETSALNKLHSKTSCHSLNKQPWKWTYTALLSSCFNRCSTTVPGLGVCTYFNPVQSFVCLSLSEALYIVIIQWSLFVAVYHIWYSFIVLHIHLVVSFSRLHYVMFYICHFLPFIDNYVVWFALIFESQFFTYRCYLLRDLVYDEKMSHGNSYHIFILPILSFLNRKTFFSIAI